MDGCGSENIRMYGCGLEKGWVDFFCVGGGGGTDGWIIDRCGLENRLIWFGEWMGDVVFGEWMDVVWRMDG